MIRPAAVEDHEVLVRLESELFGVDAWASGVISQEIALATRQWTVITGDHGDVVAYVVIAVVDTVADLLRIGVHPDHQRHGLASDLLAHAVTTAQDLGADRMLLEVSADNVVARKFYDTQDFVEIDRRSRYYRDGSDALVLARELLG